MIERVRKPRGRPFEPGNPGRPPGSKNKITKIVEQLTEEEAEQLIQTAVDLAKDGNVVCLRMILDRIWPPRKGQPLNIDIPSINNPQDVISAIIAIWAGLREGRITAEEASAISAVVDRSMQAINLQEVIQRIENLEKSREQKK